MNKLLPCDLAIFLKKLGCILDFKFWDAPSLTFSTHLGNNKSLVFIWAWSSIFISETVVMQISQLFMFQATHTWFIVAQVMSFGEWLSIIARSELGSDLDCSVINARSELGSDLDCYELIISLPHTPLHDHFNNHITHTPLHDHFNYQFTYTPLHDHFHNQFSCWL